MAFNYPRALQTAQRLIKNFGGPGQLVKMASSGQPTYPCTLVVIDYTLRERENESIQQTDRRALVSPEGLTVNVEEGDILVVDGQEMRVISSSPLKPASVLIMWEAQVRV